MCTLLEGRYETAHNYYTSYCMLINDRVQDIASL